MILVRIFTYVYYQLTLIFYFLSQVPIIDAQKKEIKLPGGLTTIEKDFPAFEGVIPAGSVALVGYTVGKYTTKAFPNDVSLSLNLLWVAVLAAGDDA
jgi:hypothetical protein